MRCEHDCTHFHVPPPVGLDHPTVRTATYKGTLPYLLHHTTVPAHALCSTQDFVTIMTSHEYYEDTDIIVEIKPAIPPHDCPDFLSQFASSLASAIPKEPQPKTQPWHLHTNVITVWFCWTVCGTGYLGPQVGLSRCLDTRHGCNFLTARCT